MGAGWIYNYNMRLKAEKETASVTFAGGNTEIFNKMPDGLYAPQMESRNTLCKINDVYAMITQTKETYLFGEN
jgi:hypothetical protein